MRAVDLLRGWVEGDAKHSKAQYCPENAQIVHFYNKNCWEAEILLAALAKIWMQLKYWTRQVSSTQWEDYGIPFHACQGTFTSYQIPPDNKRYCRQLHWLFKLIPLRQLFSYLSYFPSMKCCWARGIIQSDCSYLLLLLFSIFAFLQRCWVVSLN